MSKYEIIKSELLNDSKIWLITGVAGFIGSNLLEHLLKLNQTIIGIDNFATGHQKNIDEVKNSVTEKQWLQFKFIEGDIRDYELCKKALSLNIDFVLHQAALGSVPRSIADPLTSNSTNISGFLNILNASKEAKVKSFTYAASSSTYGDHTSLPKKEDVIGSPLSPYAVTKYVNELYANVYSKSYGFDSIGLRYFNVFGKRQDPNGAYAAVIPKWTASMIKNDDIYINGDGKTSRDFCFIENVVQMNILSATANIESKNHIYNVALGDRTSLNELYSLIKNSLNNLGLTYNKLPKYQDFRSGDVRHSQADISKGIYNLGYCPEFKIFDGIKKSMNWYINNNKAKG